MYFLNIVGIIDVKFLWESIIMKRTKLHVKRLHYTISVTRIFTHIYHVQCIMMITFNTANISLHLIPIAQNGNCRKVLMNWILFYQNTPSCFEVSILCESFWRFNNSSGNKLFHYFIRSSIDALHSCVNKGTCNTSVHHVSPSTMKLKTFRGNLTFQISRPVLEKY